MYFDFKKTIWERIEVDPKHEERVLQEIKSGKITTGSDVYRFVDGEYFINCENIDDTEEYMSVEENKGYSTIDVNDDEGETIWKNGKSVN